MQEAKARDVGVGVRAVAAGPPGGLDRLVPAFPDPEEVLGESGSLGCYRDGVFGG